jgi:hypothetical protein
LAGVSCIGDRSLQLTVPEWILDLHLNIGQATSVDCPAFAMVTEFALASFKTVLESVIYGKF